MCVVCPVVVLYLHSRYTSYSVSTLCSLSKMKQMSKGRYIKDSSIGQVLLVTPLESPTIASGGSKLFYNNFILLLYSNNIAF